MNGIAPGCSRIAVDLPKDLRTALDEDAARPPAIPSQEYIRRLVAHHFGYPLPSYEERKAKHLNINGSPKGKAGRKPRYAEES